MRRYGWKRDAHDPRDHAVKFGAGRPQKLPPSFSVDSMPPVYDQGDTNSCVLQCVAAAMENINLAAGLDEWLPSVSFLYYNALILEGVIEDGGCQIRTGIKSAIKYGACYNDDWSFHPETILTKPDARAYGRAHHDVITDYKRVPQTLYGIKSCLLANKPVIFGLAVYPEFESDTFDGVLHMPRTGEREIAQHAVMLRAYDDEDNRFIVRNSYGTPWGLPKAPGHFSVPYELILEPSLASDFWVINSTGIGQ
jgi:C1A family cysteine protease